MPSEGIEPPELSQLLYRQPPRRTGLTRHGRSGRFRDADALAFNQPLYHLSYGAGVWRAYEDSNPDDSFWRRASLPLNDAPKDQPGRMQIGLNCEQNKKAATRAAFQAFSIVPMSPRLKHTSVVRVKPKAAKEVWRVHYGPFIS